MRQYRRDHKKAVSPVIAVILMVAITVVLADVLYVWVTTLADTSEEPMEWLKLDVDDASDSAATRTGFGTDENLFDAGETILKISQIGGTPIDWQQYSLLIKHQAMDNQFEINIISINGVPYAPGNQSTTGEVILIGFKNGDTGTGMFGSGDLVDLKIVRGSNSFWKTQSPILIL